MTFEEVRELTQKSREKLVRRKVKKYSRKINDYIKYAAKQGDVRADFCLTSENSQVSYDAVKEVEEVFSKQGYTIKISWKKTWGGITDGYYVRVRWFF